MLKIGVLVSGGGTNLQSVIDAIETGKIKNASIVRVISSKPGVYALERCKKHGIPAVVVTRKEYADRQLFTDEIVRHLEEAEVDLVLMLGFLAIVSPSLIEKYRNRIINIHPSLIPSFCGVGYYGLTPHEKALEYGVKVTGATVHFVTEEADAGPIILQKAVCINEDDTPEALQKRVMEEAEWKILPEALSLYAEGRLQVEGRKVRILKEVD